MAETKRNTQNYKTLPYNPKLKERAKELRKAGNLSEVLLWNEIKDGKFKDFDFDRQKIIGNYIVDFYCTNNNVVIEIDGSSHNDKQEYDAERDTYLKSLGLEVIHIPDKEVKINLASVMEMLHTHAALQLPRPASTQQPPRPTDTPPGEGNSHLQFSVEAKAVFDAGRELWKYYHKQPGCNVNASLYDIREHFQGRNDKGKMNNKSTDEHYNSLIGSLRDKLKVLAKKIEPKVYEYEFLKS